MNNLEYAKEELKKAGFLDKNEMYGGMIGEAVMELLAVFEKQGHSGNSAEIVSSLFKKLAMFEPLTSITGEEEEWNEVTKEVFQNKRKSDVFKEGKEGRAYYLDAIVWRESSGSCFSGSCDGILSRQYIKSFPFNSKTFIIDVTREGEDNHIKDLKDLDVVWEYYDLYKKED